MPFVTAEDGVRIHYELEGPEDGVPLVLLHGAASRIESWIEAGYVDLLKDRFRLVLVDSRGNGESDKPVRPEEYDFRTRVLDFVAVMGDAGVARAHLWGYSQGGSLTASAAIYAPQRFRSFVIGGSSPYGSQDTAYPISDEAFWEQFKERPGLKRESLLAARAAGARYRGAIQALRQSAQPVLLYAGAEDSGPLRGVREFASKYGTPCFEMAGKDHQGAFFESAAEVVPRVTAFIDEVEAASK